MDRQKIWGAIILKVKRIIKITFPLLVFLLFPCFKPPGIEYLSPVAEVVFDGWRLLSLVIAAFMYFYQGNISGVFLALSAFVFSRAISTFLNGGEIWGMLITSGSVINCCMIIELGIERNIRQLFRAILFCLGILCISNLVTILLFPDGMYKTNFTQNWLLGYDNGHVPYILPLLCYYVLYAGARRTPHLRILAFVALVSASVYITWSATAVVGCTLFIGIIIMNEMNIRPKIMHCYTYLLAVLAAFILIIFIRDMDLLRPLLEDVLHKDVVFSGRTIIWDSALAMIAIKPIFGWGVMEGTFSYASIHASHAHNYFLQIVLEGGVVGLCCFGVLVAVICKQLYKAKETSAGFLLSGLLFCLFVMSLDESYGMIVPFYAAFVFMYHVNEISAGLSQMEPVRRHVLRGINRID